MQKYEAVIVLTPSIEIEDTATVLDKLLKPLIDGGANVINTDIWGRRKLAYSINKHFEGIYTTVLFLANSANVIDFAQKLNLNESVIRNKILLYKNTFFKIGKKEYAKKDEHLKIDSAQEKKEELAQEKFEKTEVKASS